MTQAIGHSFRLRLEPISLVTRLSGHTSRGSAFSRRRALLDLGAEQLERLGGVGDRLVVDAGHEPVADLLERVQVAGAFQLVQPHLDDRVEGVGAGDQDPDRRRLALARAWSRSASCGRPSARRRPGRARRRRTAAARTRSPSRSAATATARAWPWRCPRGRPTAPGAPRARGRPARATPRRAGGAGRRRAARGGRSPCVAVTP